MFSYMKNIRTWIVNLSLSVFLIFLYGDKCLRYAQNQWEHKFLHYQVFHKN